MAAAGDATRCPEIPTRCHHCAGPLSKDMETSSWTVPPLVRDSFSMVPPVIVFSSACAGLAGGTIPAAAQLVSSSCHAAMSSPYFARSASHATMPSRSFAGSASHEDMHKTRSSSPL
ncbi:hypothetical protein U9M48_020247 [Paspalum notatum var. saurae]|uniref:Uncharacterized protein n=1 Tax=Paspalum notatum var. saurae TaxID=547442 RepID=A0AAQ3TGI8_PASNO